MTEKMKLLRNELIETSRVSGKGCSYSYISTSSSILTTTTTFSEEF